MTGTITLHDLAYWANHTEEALRSVVDRYTADSAALFVNGAEALAAEAMSIANTAWAELVRRGLA